MYFCARSLYDQHIQRIKVPDNGEMEKHIGHGDQVLKEGKPTKGWKREALIKEIYA